jgi:hypothetical protein
MSVYKTLLRVRVRVLALTVVAHGQYDRANGASVGVCISADVQRSFTDGCSESENYAVSMCILQLRSCLHNPDLMTGNATANVSSTAIAARSVSRSCGCYYEAQECISDKVCSNDIKALTAKLRSQCSDGYHCFDDASYCEPLTLPENMNPADVQLFIRPHDPYTTAVGSEGVFRPSVAEPPTSPSTARWMSSPFSVGSKSMILWRGSGYDGRDMALLIGAVAGAHKVTVQLRASPLSGSPVNVSGSIIEAGGTVSVADIRRGGHTIVLNLACDRFADPNSLLDLMADDAFLDSSRIVVRGTEGTFTCVFFL